MATQDVVSGVRQVASLVSKLGKRQKAGGDVSRLAIYVDESAPRELVGWVRDSFMPAGDAVEVDVEAVSGQGLVRVHSSSTAAIVVSGGASEVLSELVIGFAEDRLPVCVVAESALDAPEIAGRVPEGSKVALVTATSAQTLQSKLASWLVDALPDDLAFASCYPFLRDAKSDQLVGSSAAQNLFVGLLQVGGSQLPVMTANQARLAFDLARVYGVRDLSVQAVGLLSIVASGYALRGVYRGFARVAPGLKPLERAAIAFAGTLLVGAGARKWLARDGKAKEADADSGVDLLGPRC